MKYNVDFFIKFFEGIPEDLWIVGSYTQFIHHSKILHCAVGHVAAGDFRRDKVQKVYDVFSVLNTLEEGLSDEGVVTHINDGVDMRYPQETPKLRILAALHDIKAMQAVEQVQEIIDNHKIVEHELQC